VLTDRTKLEIAVWLLGVKVGQKVEPWPDTFAKVFDRVFGTKHLSWKCFWRSCIASFAASLLTVGTYWIHKRVAFETTDLARISQIAFFVSTAGTFLPDYLSLLKTRWFISLMSRWNKDGWRIGLLMGDLLITGLIAVALLSVLRVTFTVDYIEGGKAIPWWAKWRRELGVQPFLTGSIPEYINSEDAPLWFYPPFFTSLWLWLYAGSGFILKVARRFDIGFEWFNRKFDIEKKPLQSIGLVAGVLVAVVYWAVAIVSRVF
jgi:hypothetical protein